MKSADHLLSTTNSLRITDYDEHLNSNTIRFRFAFFVFVFEFVVSQFEKVSFLLPFFRNHSKFRQKITEHQCRNHRSTLSIRNESNKEPKLCAMDDVFIDEDPQQD